MVSQTHVYSGSGPGLSVFYLSYTIYSGVKRDRVFDSSK